MGEISGVPIQYVVSLRIGTRSPPTYGGFTTNRRASTMETIVNIVKITAKVIAIIIAVAIALYVTSKVAIKAINKTKDMMATKKANKLDNNTNKTASTKGDNVIIDAESIIVDNKVSA